MFCTSNTIGWWNLKIKSLNRAQWARHLTLAKIWCFPFIKFNHFWLSQIDFWIREEKSKFKYQLDSKLWPFKDAEFFKIFKLNNKRGKILMIYHFEQKQWLYNMKVIWNEKIMLETICEDQRLMWKEFLLTIRVDFMHFALWKLDHDENKSRKSPKNRGRILYSAWHIFKTGVGDIAKYICFWKLYMYTL